MRLLEIDIEDLIWDKLQSKEGIQLLEKKGLNCESIFLGQREDCKTVFIRQMNLGAYGIPDIVSITDQGYLSTNRRMIRVHVIELKATEASVDNFQQAFRYMSGLRHFLTDLTNISPKNTYLTVNGSLITRGFDSVSDPYFMDYVREDLSLFSIQFDLEEGFVFKPESYGWRKTEPNFSDDFTGSSIIGDDMTLKDMIYNPSEEQIQAKKETESNNLF